MAIRIYSDYEEFRSTEEELSEFLDEMSYINGDYDSEEEDQLFLEMNNTNISIKEDANFYIVCDDSDEETAEDLASHLGVYKKINLEDLHKTFFYLI
jgi:hypothetical protein